MTVHTGDNVAIDVEKTLETAVTISGMSVAAGVITLTASAAHGLTGGEYIKISIGTGTVELDTQVVRVTNIVSLDFDLEGIDGTGFTAWGTGSFEEISDWNVLCLSTGWSFANAAPNEIDATTSCDTVKVTRFGIPGSKTGSISINHDAQVAAVQYLEARTSSDVVAFKMRYPNTVTRVFGAYTAYGGGFAGALDTIETGEVPVTIPRKIVEYTT